MEHHWHPGFTVQWLSPLCPGNFVWRCTWGECQKAERHQVKTALNSALRWWFSDLLKWLEAAWCSHLQLSLHKSSQVLITLEDSHQGLCELCTLYSEPEIGTLTSFGQGTGWANLRDTIDSKARSPARCIQPLWALAQQWPLSTWGLVVLAWWLLWF